MLEETGVFEGMNLPAEIGGLRLEAVALRRVILVAPFKGQVMAVADVLHPRIGLVLPPVGQVAESGKTSAFWFRRGQWLVFGESGLMRETCVALAGMAAVTDMSDAVGKLRLTGGVATGALGRLCALDLEKMVPGSVAQSALADIPASVMAIDGGFDLLVPRSFAGSVVRRLQVAMRSTVSRSMVE